MGVSNSGKGSSRRPAQVADAELQSRWDLAFSKSKQPRRYSDAERYQVIREVMMDLGKQKQCEGLWFAEPNTYKEFDAVVDALITNLRK